MTPMTPKVIGTHDGCFHCDEVLACYMLRKLPEYRNANILRSREDSVLDTCDIVVDVGGVYDHSKKRYDHHMKTFTDSLSTLRPPHKSTIKLSSAGLVFHHYGEQILQTMVDQKLDSEMIDNCFNYVYDHFIKEVDAIDNGIEMFPGKIPVYHISTNLGSRISDMHPAWNEDQSKEAFERQFYKAMQVAGAEFNEVVRKFMKVWWPARELVEKAIDNRFNVHPSGQIIEIPICPWLQHVYDLEEKNGIGNQIKFGIFKDNNWRVRVLNLGPGSFDLRAPLHAAWRGLRDAELQEISGIPDAVFVHATGFIGGVQSREGAIEMAVKTMEYEASQNGN